MEETSREEMRAEILRLYYKELMLQLSHVNGAEKLELLYKAAFLFRD